MTGQARTGRAAKDATIAAWIAMAILGTASIAAPLALGGTPAIAAGGLHLVMAAAICLWAPFLRPGLMLLAFPLVCFALPLLQLAPLPDKVLVAVAPVSAGAWKVAHAGLTDIWARISIDPAETAAAARRALLATGTVIAVSELSRRARPRQCLVAALAVSAAVIWTLGLAFPVKVNSFLLLGSIDFKGPLMPGRTPVEPPPATAGFGFPEVVRVAGRQYAADSWAVGDGFGPYLVTNHFAGAITLTVPFLVAAWLVMSGRHFPSWLRYAVATTVFASATATLAALVQSRAGTASFVLAALVFACLAAPAGRWRQFVVAVTLTYVAAVAVFLVALFGPFNDVHRLFPYPFQAPLAALLSDGRVVATKVAERMFLASPLLGTGLGTYGDLYPVMVRDGIPWYFAHNEYAQLLAEAGLVGLLVAAVPATFLGQSAWRFWRSAVGMDRILGAGAWAAVAGIAMHSCFDWNLRVPANAFLTCLAAGVALASGPSLRIATPAAAPTDRLRSALAAAFVLAVVAATGYLIRDTVSEYTQRQLREAIVAARRHASDPNAPSPEDALVRAIAAGERMAPWDPADAQLAVALGQANLHLSTLPMPIDEADACITRAEKWFRIARGNCAVCRGIAEPQDAEAAHRPR